MTRELTRRGFAELSLAGLAAVAAPRGVLAAAQCVVPPNQSFLPNILTVNCASRQNFKLFRANSEYVGLAGVVSMTKAEGAHGTYDAGSLFLYPWLKPAGQKLRKSTFAAYLPTGNSTSTSSKPIPNATLPLDEYYCRLVLRAPWQSFIGFTVDVPPDPAHALSGDWRTTVPKLADGQGVDIDWTSANLNRAWFGGSNAIPSQAICNGAVWRSLIADGLNTVASAAC